MPAGGILTVWLDGLPQGNPPRALAFKLKAALSLQATPVLMSRRRSCTAALLLPGTEGDAARLRQAAAQGLAFAVGDTTRPLPELGLGPSIRLTLGAAATAAAAVPAGMSEKRKDARPWGAFVMQRTADSNLAPGPRSTPPPEAETWESVHGLLVSETAKRV
jgi:hypothetical protein